MERAIKLPNQNKKAGVINSANNFVTYRKQKHFFKKYGGFGISQSVLAILRKNEVKKIIIIFENEEGIQIKRKLYVTTLEEFYENGKEYKDKNDYQLVLSLDFFDKPVLQ